MALHRVAEIDRITAPTGRHTRHVAGTVVSIATTYWAKPIPDRSHDWIAVDDDRYDGAEDSTGRARMFGSGATEADAIADLLSQIEDYEEERQANSRQGVGA